MINQINWTALPGGRHDFASTRARLTLFASLRIENPPECPEIFDWPATVAGLRFRVLFENGSPNGFSENNGTLHRVTATAPSASAWKQVFGHVLSRPALLGARRARADAELLAVRRESSVSTLLKLLPHLIKSTESPSASRQARWRRLNNRTDALPRSIR